jgi:1-acyl-sn-glycerol-3-phosphate acyltransferase
MAAASDLLPSPLARLRAGVRFILLVACVVLSWCGRPGLRGRGRRAQADWLAACSRRLVALLGLRLEVHGPVPATGLLVANHLGYLDIIVLSAVTRCVFVSKKEVAAWPLFGPSARWGGTIFVDRSRRTEVAEVAVAMRAALAEGVLVALFPEGTSSGGAEVLPFKPALFAPVVELGCAVTACALDYALPGGSVPDEVCYWGDDTLAPHLFNLLGKTGLAVRVAFGPSAPRPGDRKTAARLLHAEVTALRRPPFGCALADPARLA